MKKRTTIQVELFFVLLTLILFGCQSQDNPNLGDFTPTSGASPPGEVGDVQTPTADVIEDPTPTTAMSDATSTPEEEATSSVLRSPTATPTPSSLATLPPEIPVLPMDGKQAASDLESETDCIEGTRMGYARLSWTPALDAGSEQRVAVTIYKNGFELGEFEVSESLPPDQNMLVWDAIHGQANHYWRILTRQSDGWVPSETQLFVGPSCVADIPSG